jgi:hypothetical protein
MAFDPEKVPVEHADLFYHGKPGPDGKPVGLTDEEYDAQRDRMIADPDQDWPFGQPAESD